MKKNNYAVTIVVLLCLVSFIVGYIRGEGWLSAAHYDFVVFHRPTIEYFRKNQLGYALRDYNSATTPLFHILTGISPLNTEGHGLFRLSVLISILDVACFGILIWSRFRTSENPIAIAALFASALLVSPYYRTQAYWPTTDNLATALLVLTLLCLNSIERGSSRRILWFVGACIFSALTFYTRQTYVWLVAYTALVPIFERSIARAWSLLPLLLMTPAALLFLAWRGLMPPRFQLHHQGFTLEGVAFVFFLVPFFCSPFIIASPRQFLRQVQFGRWWVADSIIATMFVVLRLLCPHVGMKGSGIIIGGLFTNLIFRSPRVGMIVYELLVFIGAMITVGFFRRVNAETRILVVLVIGSVLLLRVSYQRYYDPLILILFLGLAQRDFVRRHFTARAAWLVLAFETSALGVKVLVR